MARPNVGPTQIPRTSCYSYQLPAQKTSLHLREKVSLFVECVAVLGPAVEHRESDQPVARHVHHHDVRARRVLLAPRAHALLQARRQESRRGRPLHIKRHPRKGQILTRGAEERNRFCYNPRSTLTFSSFCHPSHGSFFSVISPRCLSRNVHLKQLALFRSQTK